MKLRVAVIVPVLAGVLAGTSGMCTYNMVTEPPPAPPPVVEPVTPGAPVPLLPSTDG